MDTPTRGISPPPAGPAQGASHHLLVATADGTHVRITSYPTLMRSTHAALVVHSIMARTTRRGVHHTDRSLLRLPASSRSVGTRSFPFSGGGQGSALVRRGHCHRNVPLYQKRASHLASSAAYALLGHIVMGDEAYLMIATKIRESVTLPGGHSVYSIVDSRAVRIPLWRSFVEASATQTRAHAGPPPNRLLSVIVLSHYAPELLRSFPFESAHYYCETCDITQPFPSPPVLQHKCASAALHAT